MVNRNLKRKVYAGFTSLFLATSMVSVVSAPAVADTPVCGVDGSPTVTWLNDPQYYFSVADSYDATYIGYTVTPASDVDNLWVGLSDFTGGLVGLAPTQSQFLASGPTSGGVAKTSYFLSQTTATATTATPQSHTVTVYEGNPNKIGAVALCSATNTFTGVEDTITANSNKVDNIVSSAATAVVGNTVDVTVFGDTGTIGAGPAVYNGTGVINLTPAVESSFPANSWRLSKIVYNNLTSGITYTDMLQLLDAANMGTHSYSVVYSFQAVGTTATPATIIPIQYISSGTQIKHTGAFPAALPSLPEAVNTLTISKSADVSTVPSDGGEVEYTVSVVNSGEATTIDELSDTLPAGATYKAGSATKDGVAIADPASFVGVEQTALSFVGPYSVPAEGSIVFTYTVTLPGVYGVYTNTAVGYVSSSQIDTTLDTSDNSPAFVGVTVLPLPPTVNPVSETVNFGTPKTVTPEATGTTLDTSTACLVDPADSVCKDSVTIENEGTWTVDDDGAVTFTPVVGTTGPVSQLIYEISDSYNQKGSSTVDFTIADPVGPTLSDPGVVNIPEGQQVTKDLEVTPGDGAITDYCFIVGETCVKTETTDEGTWTIDNNGTVSFTPVDGFTGQTSTISIQVTDEYGLTDTTTIAFIVPEPLPVGPTLSAPGVINVPEGQQGTKDLEVTPGDGAITDYCFIVGEDCVQNTTTDEGTWTIDSNGTVTFVPVDGFTGQTSNMVIQVTDANGLTDSKTIAFAIPEPTPVGPTLSDPGVINVAEGQQATKNLEVTPGDGAITGYCFIVGEDCVQNTTTDEGTWTIDNNGTVSFTPVDGFTGQTSGLMIQVTDANGLTDSKTIAFVIPEPTPTPEPEPTPEPTPTPEPEPTVEHRLDLLAEDGDPAEGSEAEYLVKGILSGSKWSIVLDSTSEVLASGVAEPTGLLEGKVILPPGLEPGWHKLTLYAIDVNGNQISDVVWFEISAAGIIIAQTEELAYTGSSLTELVSSLVLGFGTMLLGFAMLFVRRRYKTGV